MYFLNMLPLISLPSIFFSSSDDGRLIFSRFYDFIVYGIWNKAVPSQILFLDKYHYDKYITFVMGSHVRIEFCKTINKTILQS